MYEIYTANKRVEKNLHNLILIRKDIKSKLKKLKINPRKELDAHPLHGRLNGKWSCWLGNNIRIIYSINDKTKQIIIEAAGSHKSY